MNVLKWKIVRNKYNDNIGGYIGQVKVCGIAYNVCNPTLGSHFLVVDLPGTLKYNERIYGNEEDLKKTADSMVEKWLDDCALVNMND